MNTRSLSLVLRSTFLVRNFGKLESTTGPESLYDPAYSGNHVAIFECQLKTPSSMALIDRDLMQYINLQKMSMNNWRLVDVDHFMKGNTFFNRLVNELDWHKDVESKIGTQSERTVNIKESDQVKDMRSLTDTYINYINIKEPRSNRGLEEFKTKDQMETEKNEAKAKAEEKIKES